MWELNRNGSCEKNGMLACRCEQLEEQLNDLMELHQNEALDLKQELASLEEKIAYQSYERGRDVQVSHETKIYLLLITTHLKMARCTPLK